MSIKILPPGEPVNIADVGFLRTYWSSSFRALCVSLPFQLKVAPEGRREDQKIKH